MTYKHEKVYEVLKDLNFWSYEESLKPTQHDKNSNLVDDHVSLVNKYVLYTEHRLQLFEWMLIQYDKSILERNPINLNSQIERMKRIRDSLFGIGLLSTNKYTKNIDHLKIIEGISGADAALNLIYQVAKFVKFSKKPSSEFDNDDSNTLLINLIQNKPSLVNVNLNLFPIDFPKKYDVAYEDIPKNLDKIQKRISNEINELDEDRRTKIDTNEMNYEIVYANQELKTVYEQKLLGFRANLAEFVEESKAKKLKIKNLISKFETNKVKFPAKLSEFIDVIIETKEKAKGLDKEIIEDNLIEKIVQADEMCRSINLVQFEKIYMLLFAV